MKHQKSLNGLWHGSLDDGPAYSKLVADFNVVGGMLIGEWHEEHIGGEANERRAFKSELTGYARGVLADLTEKRDDGEKFQIQFTLSPCGNKLIGQWRRAHPNAVWYQVDLYRKDDPAPEQIEKTSRVTKVAALFKPPKTGTETAPALDEI